MNIFSDDSINLNTSMENSFSKNNHKSVISTNSNSLPYAINEINNENFPFENINLNLNNISFNITPAVIKDSLNTNYIFKSKSIINKEKKNVLITSYNYLVVIKIYEFTITKKEKINKNIIRQFTKISKKSLISRKSLKSKKSLKSRKSLKSKKSKKSFGFSINYKNSLISNDTIKLDDDVHNFTKIYTKRKLIKSSSTKSIKRENSLKSSLSNNKLLFMNKAGTKNYALQNTFNFNRVKSLKPNFGKNSDLYKRQKSMQKSKPMEKRRMSKMLFLKKKSFLKIDEDSKLKNTKTVEQSFDNDNTNSSPGAVNRTNILDLISQNIEKNSLNLNNPQIFYENYFKNVINLNSNRIENKDVSSRLSDIGKLIKKKNKKLEDNKN